MKFRILNGNTIKIIAAITMVIDHIGLLFFPDILALRAVGRISMPLFAMMVAEGCRYTRNKFRHVGLIALLGAAYSVVYYLLSQEVYFSILTTFTLSILMIYVLQAFQRNVFYRRGVAVSVCSGAAFVCLVVFAYLFTARFTLDYGFWGCMLPVFAELFDWKAIGKQEPRWAYYLRLACFAVCLFLQCLSSVWAINYFALLALIPLLLYNEKKGRLKLKYFFYVFYPAHLAILYGILVLIYYIG